MVIYTIVKVGGYKYQIDNCARVTDITTFGDSDNPSGFKVDDLYRQSIPDSIIHSGEQISFHCC